jgi:hypothetical protein
MLSLPQTMGVMQGAKISVLNSQVRVKELNSQWQTLSDAHIKQQRLRVEEGQ